MDQRVERIAALRAVMKDNAVDVLLIPTCDPHVTEYVPPRWQGRHWVSGFSGSLGNLVITADTAILFTEPLYWVQAAKQLDGSAIELYKETSGSVPGLLHWLETNLSKGSTVSIPQVVTPLNLYRQLGSAIESRKSTLLTDVDLLAQIWDQRPAPPEGEVFPHMRPQATPDISSKIDTVREAMATHGATHYFISALEDIAWLTNLRGSDIDCTPIFMAHCLVNPAGVDLFVNDTSMTAGAQSQMETAGITVRNYDMAFQSLGELAGSARLLVDPSRVTAAVLSTLPQGVTLIENTNPTTLAKSKKTDAQINHFRQAMTEDGIAMCEFYSWFERALEQGDTVTELNVHERLTEERAKRPGFLSLSFPTIAGFNGNGAMPHYQATADSCSTIQGDGFLLIDSGGQYAGGTTDITRTWQIGSVSQQMKIDYTMVLKAHIALSSTRFPRGTLSPMLDAIARKPMWELGMDYGHGTGHGVGYCLCVHEGPQTFRQAIPTPQMAMEVGMVTSIEPALYREGAWGVRTENLVANVPAQVEEGNRYGEFLEFEALSLCPIDTSCLLPERLTDEEKQWLNRYHAAVRERLLPHLSSSAGDWLERRTQAIT